MTKKISGDKTAKKRGRPPIVIDWKVVDKLCSISCTQVEICEFLEISIDTLERRLKKEKKCTFAEYFKRKSSAGKISLRRAQYKAALKGNTTMLIWLGKQHLDQKDESHTEVDMGFTSLSEAIKEKNKG